MKRLAQFTRSILLGASLVALTACGGAQKDTIKLADLKQDASPAEKAFHAGLKSYIAEDWKKASGHFQEAYKLDPAATGARVNLGITLEKAGDWQAAAEVYREGAKADPTNVAAALNVARMLTNGSDYAAASAALVTALEANANNEDLLNAYASTLRGEKKFKEAADQARKVILRDQKNPEALKNLALIYADDGKLTLAETFFMETLKLTPKDASIYVNLGLIASRRDKPQVALYQFEEALKLDPKNSAAHLNIGAISLGFRDYGRAETSLQSAIDNGLGGNCNALAALGYSFEGLQKAKEAVDQFGKVLEICPAEVDVLYTMGNICMAQLRDNECALSNFMKFATKKKGLASDHMVHMMIKSIKQMIEMEAAGPEAIPEEAPAEEPVESQESAPEGEVASTDAPPTAVNTETAPADETSGGGQ
ncbi:MAG: tetratricopeptide repeat protein [Deltaproteobacteria bacterium]|jgi:tetratricopeptide (TPR) repeat protein|nr:tetratricopeptide repeat protein [Deltaproteobacteria bacterium]MBT6433200.1 tetratricopeptide repeat protein [Deltaproteobacteria bacterium]MBT6491853.1 tetratricopeptide repeat protein [Deltaproteobacteria bacterium]